MYIESQTLIRTKLNRPRVANERGARSTALMYRALSQQAQGDIKAAVSALEHVIGDPTGLLPSKIQAFAALTIIYIVDGRFDKVSHSLQRFQVYAEETQATNAIALVNLLAIFLQYEWDDLEAASRHSKLMLDLRYRSNNMGTITSLSGLARFAQIHGDLEKAQQYIDEFRTDVHRQGNTDFLPLLESVQAYQWFLHNEGTRALHWTRSFDPLFLEEPWVWFEIPSLTQARIIATAGNGDELRLELDTLQQLLSKAQNRHFTLRVIQFEVHRALIHDKLGQKKQALHRLEHAIQLAEPGRLIRSFVDAGPAIAGLLRRLLAGRSKTDLTAAYIQQILSHFPQSNVVTAKTPVASTYQPLVEALTAREKDVLQLMQKGMSNQQIADALVISPHTVRTHANNIYGKLGVSGRRYAVQKASDLGILSAN